MVRSAQQGETSLYGVEAMDEDEGEAVRLHAEVLVATGSIGEALVGASVSAASLKRGLAGIDPEDVVRVGVHGGPARFAAFSLSTCNLNLNRSRSFL